MIIYITKMYCEVRKDIDCEEFKDINSHTHREICQCMRLDQ